MTLHKSNDSLILKNNNNNSELKITAIPSGHGDCILVQCDAFNILIDSGPSAATLNDGVFEKLQKKLSNQPIHLAISTHSDDDHIGGMIKFLQSNKLIIKEHLFNSPKLIQNFIDDVHKKETTTSANQALQLARLLPPHNKKVIISDEQYFFDDNKICLDILSPTSEDIINFGSRFLKPISKEKLTGQRGRTTPICGSISDLLKLSDSDQTQDQSYSNALSLAFILNFSGERILFLRDSWPSRTSQSIKKSKNGKERLDISMVFVSHHGSKKNTTIDFYNNINTDNFFISTDGKQHPDIEVFSRILKSNRSNKPTFYFPQKTEELTTMLHKTDLNTCFMDDKSTAFTFNIDGPKKEPNLHYGHNENSSEILIYVDKVAQRMGKSVVPVWRYGNNGERLLIGSAFFACKDGIFYLITALHNFDENPELILYIECANMIFSLNEMRGITSINNDLWIAKLCDELQNILKNVVIPPLKHKFSNNPNMGTGSLLLGFPGSFNGNTTEFNLLPLSTSLEVRGINIGKAVKAAVVYNLPNEYFYNSDGTPSIKRPNIEGMSGGPAYGWIAYYDENNEFRFHYFLQGMISRWDPQTGYVVACNAAGILELAKQAI